MSFLATYVGPLLCKLAVLIVIHELGHYAVARYFGVSVDTFAVGFGPRLVGRQSRRTGTDWCVRAIPLGGYVKFASAETGDRKLDGVALEGLARWKRIAILAAGPAVNLAFAPLIFYAFVLTQGVSVYPPEAAGVLEDSPAAEAGIEAGDVLVSVEGEDVLGMGALSSRARIGLGKPITTAWRSDAGVVTHVLVPELRTVEMMGRSSEVGLVGVKMYPPERVDVGPWTAVGHTADLTAEQARNMLLGLWQIGSGQRGMDEMMGVVGMGHLSGEVVQNSGYAQLLMLMGIVSLSLGIVNLLPIPVLDGGQITVLAYEGVTRRKVSQRAEDALVRVGIAMVAALLLVTLWNDLAAIWVVVSGGA